ncbi:MAG: MalY/PatB family protein [Paracoccus sp. (in: a-proteobacteria)]|uniref:MalY/PatB family protein n=1 Tax=Paracoccus sp. TaxID=267 RepID=UPI0026DFCA2B|nr:MalY/PatB family protein [Paracoccus sp. (in: a-proteobacteria)]MDO5622142.1 MalY/PatB family protein [Paracoccus sp. (in: a-proteobacteria)]
MTPDFDEIIDRRGTRCNKWDDMQAAYGVSPDDGISMWVADMDFRPPAAVQAALQSLLDHGVYGYPGRNDAYLDAICWWQQNRHGWQIGHGDILTVHGLVNGTALAVAAYTRPGDGVCVMSPVYHAFGRVIRAAGRELVELPMQIEDGLYHFDAAAWDARMTGHERAFILCSPHNPGGRVWSEDELRAIADFCIRHDLVLISDEIHQDIIMPGAPRHIPTALAAPQVMDRLVVLSSATKTFNIAGAHIGHAIIPDPALRKAYQDQMAALGLSPGLFGLPMVTAAYSPEGAEWVDALCTYLDGNRRLFDDAVNAIPGLQSMPLQATYLAWVDFAGTGMDRTEFTARVERDARIAANHGPTFGAGGDSFMRFNLATPRARVREAAARLQAAFTDLQ